MNQTEEIARRTLLHYCQVVYSKGWVANHDGNLSTRLGDNLLCTPTAVSKGDVTAEMLIVVNDNNEVVQGTRRTFSELQLHRAAYRARPDIGCVIHAHPPTATGFCVAHKALGQPFMAEPIVSLGANIPLVPFFPPKDPRLDVVIEEALQTADVLMLTNHGVLSVGGSFEQAFLRLELVEHLCKIALVAHQLGGPVALERNVVEQLAAKGRPTSNPDFSPRASGNDEKASSSASERPDLAQLIADNRQRLG